MCPLGHGSVGVGPFPGYVHGTHPAVCPEGRTPDLGLRKGVFGDETPHQALVREMLEYQDLHHRVVGDTTQMA